MKIKSKKAGAFPGCILSFFLTWLLFDFFSVQMNIFIFVPVMCAAYILIERTAKIKSRRLLISAAVFAFLLSASFIAGQKIDTNEKVMGSFELNDAVCFLGLSMLFFFAVCCIIEFAIKHMLITSVSDGKSTSSRFWIISSIVLFICWLPSLFIYYPGNISADSLACIIRAIGKAHISNQQPVFYIILMRPFLLFGLARGSLNLGIAIFALFQLTAVACITGYALYSLRKKGCPLWAVMAAGAYFIFNPVFSMYAVTIWKDVLFGGLILLYALDIYDIVESRGEKLKSARGMIWFIFLSVVICFIKNNGLYIVAATLIVILIVFRKNWKRLVPVFLPVLICVPIIQGPVYSACGVLPNPFAESLAVPLQQMGRTVKKDGKINVRQREFLNNLLPEDVMKKAYNPLTADGIKFNKNFNNEFLETHKAEFFKTWAGMLKNNTKEYVKAYCMETVGYWHIGTNNWIFFKGVADARDSHINGIASTDLLSGAAGYDLRKNDDNYYKSWMKIPVLSDLMNIGLLFWLTVLSAVISSVKKGKKYIVPFLPLLFLWGTLMLAAPTFCEFRYMFSFAAFLPFAITLPFLPKQKSDF